MEIRFQNSTKETSLMDTQQLRDSFLVEKPMQFNEIKLVYSHYDRMIVGGAVPVSKKITLPNEAGLRASYFLERRELGVINVGDKGTVTADGKDYEIEKLECVYLGKGTKAVSFSSASKKEPAHFYFLSVPAHHIYLNKKMTKKQAAPVTLGESVTSNKRTIYKYIHNNSIRSCQLVMGLTVLEEGNVWNSVPPNSHTRRMETYFYFNRHSE